MKLASSAMSDMVKTALSVTSGSAFPAMNVENQVQYGFVELGKNVKGWTQGVPVEPEALQQLKNISRLPILGGHVAVMPDVHLGMGATVGSVIASRGAIIPAAVGVDIGCGMNAVKTSLTENDLPDSLHALRRDIEAAIPVGFNAHKRVVVTRDLGDDIYSQAIALRDRFETLRILQYAGKLNRERVWLQAGTLGGGNHFIEVCLSEEGDVWLMLHSGSRNVGKVFAEVAISMAKEIAARQNRDLPDKNLAWLDEGSKEFDVYTEALAWAQDYARHNRAVMMSLLKRVMKQHFGDRFRATDYAINCHHNYAEHEVHFGRRLWITRKGAVSARKGQLGIIPGSMGARSYIVRGKGNPMAYQSCAHGAGRVMSRTAARKRFSRDDLIRQTTGVECRKDKNVIDEIPAAYKDIDQVMEAQKDLVDTVAVLKQVLCVKG